MSSGYQDEPMEELAGRQGVRPVESVHDMAMPDLFESDEELREFLADLYASRRGRLGTSAPEIWGDRNQALTVEDLEDLPDDEFRYELDDGVLVAFPVPPLSHQLAVSRLALLLQAACPPELLAIIGCGINIGEFQHRVPDLVVIRKDSFTPTYLVDPPMLAVEVASPRTRVYDLGRKMGIYERFGIGSYWIVEPGPERPGLTVFELHRGRYVRTAEVTGSDSLDMARPFPVTIVPTDLVATGSG